MIASDEVPPTVDLTEYLHDQEDPLVDTDDTTTAIPKRLEDNEEPPLAEAAKSFEDLLKELEGMDKSSLAESGMSSLPKTIKTESDPSQIETKSEPLSHTVTSEIVPSDSSKSQNEAEQFVTDKEEIVEHSRIPMEYFALIQAENMEIRPWFDEAWTLMQSSIDEDEFSMSLSQMHVPADMEQTRLLFDLAREGIENPEEIDKYEESFSFTETRKVEATALSKELETFEEISKRALSSPSLAKVRGKIEATPIRQIVANQSEPLVRNIIRPALTRRLFAGFVDTFCVLFSLVIITACYIKFMVPDYSNLVLDSVHWTPTNLAAFAQVFLLIAAPGVFVIPTLIAFAFGSLPGLKITGQTLVTSERLQPSTSQIFCRAALLPLSIITGGLIPILWRGKPLHDWLAGLDSTITPIIQRND